MISDFHAQFVSQPIISLRAQYVVKWCEARISIHVIQNCKILSVCIIISNQVIENRSPHEKIPILNRDASPHLQLKAIFKSRPTEPLVFFSETEGLAKVLLM